MSNHLSQYRMNTNVDFHEYTDYYDTCDGELKIISDFNDRVMSFDELTTLTDIIVAVNKVYRHQYKTKLSHVTLDSVHLYGNCNDDNDIAVIYRCGCEQFEIRYCSPCSNWFVSYCYVNGDGTIETNNRITNLQLASDLTTENVVEWLFNTMSILDY